jgi:hypothetical protein
MEFLIAFVALLTGLALIITVSAYAAKSLHGATLLSFSLGVLLSTLIFLLL